MIAKVSAYEKTRAPLQDAKLLWRKDCEFAVIPRIGEWVTCVDDDQFDEHDIFVVKSVMHTVREYPRRHYEASPFFSEFEPWTEIIIEIR
jgi:hypothetical protein